ncbi:metallophosphoesterase [Microbulbifer sp. JMSA004]|uniref:metallophosphoesterase n=1 Tax=Microbulbifer sp. JMSA004 TaxID=3243370 RepID=UPI00403A10AD
MALRKLRITFIVLCCLGLLLAIWAFFVEPSSLRIKQDRIEIKAWPKTCNDLRIAVLADLHVGSPYKGLESLRKLVAAVNKSKPDLILLPGDFVIQGVVGGSFVSPEDAARILKALRAPMGVFAVLGNHDWWLDAERVELALSQNGIPVLEDRSQLITKGSCKLRLVGISDFWEGPHDIDRAMSDVQDGETVLAFTHNPDIFPQLPARIALTVAGHTHGGQVYLPFIGRPIVPSSYGERFAIGHKVEEGRHIYVSPGVGTSILPVRFLVPPEVTILAVSNGSS